MKPSAQAGALQLGLRSSAGVPVVFVHGAIEDFREWEPQRRAAAEHDRFVAYSLRQRSNQESQL